MRLCIAVRTTALSVFAICTSKGFSISDLFPVSVSEILIENRNFKLLPCLTRLQLDRYVGVTDSFTLISVGLTQPVHLRGHLSKLLLVDTGKCQRRLVLLDTALCRKTLSLRLDSFRQGKFNRMRIAK